MKDIIIELNSKMEFTYLSDSTIDRLYFTTNTIPKIGDRILDFVQKEDKKKTVEIIRNLKKKINYDSFFSFGKINNKKLYKFISQIRIIKNETRFLIYMRPLI